MIFANLLSPPVYSCALCLVPRIDRVGGEEKGSLGKNGGTLASALEGAKGLNLVQPKG